METRRCPGCQQPLPVGTGVYFDAAHNVFCCLCNTVVLAARPEQERAEKKPPVQPHNAYWKNPHRQIDVQGVDHFTNHYEDSD